MIHGNNEKGIKSFQIPANLTPEEKFRYCFEKLNEQFPVMKLLKELADK